MNKMMKSLTILAVAAVLILIPVSAKGNLKMGCGEFGGMGMGFNGQNFGGGIMDVPDLTEEQIGKIEKAQLDHHKKMIELQYKKELKLMDLHEAMQINLDEKKALAAADEIGKIDIEMQKAKISNHFAMRKLLTKDQLKYLDMHRPGMTEGKGMGMKNGNGEPQKMDDCRNCGK